MHNFGAKLSDPRVASVVGNYLEQARRRRGSSPAAAEAAPDGCAPGPVSINLDLTLACDYRCGHCIDAELLNGGRHLPLDTVLGTLEVLVPRGLRSVILIGGGEPTLHPFFEDVVAGTKRLKLDCAISTNGAHNERIAGVASMMGPRDWVRLSLDAGTDETFQLLHRPKKPLTLEHICRTAASLKQRAPQVQLGFSFVVIWNAPGPNAGAVVTNVHEMPQAVALAKAHGFDYISFKPMLMRDPKRAEVVNLGRSPHGGTGLTARDMSALGEIRNNMRAAQSMADSRFRVVPSKNLIALLDGFSLERSALQPRECHMQQFRQVVTPDGIFACPAHRGNEGSRLAGPAGYATPEAFEGVVQATQVQIRRFNAAVECREITCIYNDANWWLEDLIESGEPIQHLGAADFFL